MKTENTATIDTSAATKFTSAHRKEGKCYLHTFTVIDLQNPEWAAINLRTYGTGGSTVTACLWLNASPIHISGSGSARGYGYCRKSAAAADAIRNAGITLEKRIEGVGMSAVRDALLAIATAAGFKSPFIVESYA